MAPGEVPGSQSNISVLHPPSTCSSHQPRPRSPSVPSSDAQYRGCHLRRANIFVDDDESVDINYYSERKVFHEMMGDLSVHGIFERISKIAKELVKRPSEEAEWTNALYSAMYQLSWEGIEFVCNRGKLVTVRSSLNIYFQSTDF